MKVWSTLTALLGVAAATEAEPEAVEAVEDAVDLIDAADEADAYTYRRYYCTSAASCYGSSRCGHYRYWYNHNYYDFKTCVAPTTCGSWITRGTGRAYVYCS